MKVEVEMGVKMNTRTKRMRMTTMMRALLRLRFPTLAKVLTVRSTSEPGFRLKVVGGGRAVRE